MIAGIFHEGSGLGDQLFRYVAVRTLAEEKKYGFSMLNPENFKGIDFMKLCYPTVHRPAIRSLVTAIHWNEKDVRDAQGNDTRSYDPEINFVGDNTIIDGSFEDDKYWGHNLQNIASWLAVEPLEVPDDTCIIGFRGGEYKAVSELFLPKSFYFEGAEIMKRRGVINFEVHTDDPEAARDFFPDFKVIDNQRISHSKHTKMGLNWRSARYAKNAIIPNSAFFILPRHLAHHDMKDALTIAPRYWARRNTKGPWRPAAYYKQFTYI